MAVEYPWRHGTKRGGASAESRTQRGRPISGDGLLEVPTDGPAVVTDGIGCCRDATRRTGARRRASRGIVPRVPDPVICAVLAANQAFYDAHEQRDLAAMGAVWEHDDRTVCVHPGWPILRTWLVIEESWRRIFAGPGRSQFILTNEAVAVDGDLAWVTLEENL